MSEKPLRLLSDTREQVGKAIEQAMELERAESFISKFENSNNPVALKLRKVFNDYLKKNGNNIDSSGVTSRFKIAEDISECLFNFSSVTEMTPGLESKIHDLVLRFSVSELDRISPNSYVVGTKRNFFPCIVSLLRAGEDPETIKENIFRVDGRLSPTQRQTYFNKVSNLMTTLNSEKDVILNNSQYMNVYPMLEVTVDKVIQKSFHKLMEKEEKQVYNLYGVAYDKAQEIYNTMIPGSQEILDGVNETLALIYAKFKISMRLPKEFPLTNTLDFSHEVIELKEDSELYKKILPMYFQDRESDYGKEMAERDEKNLVDLIKQGKITAHVYKKDSDIGCFVLSEEKDNGEIYLFGLTSAPLLKKSGIPTFLFNELFSELNKEHTLTGWVYKENKAALNFYRKAGAEIVEETNDNPQRLILRIPKKEPCKQVF